MILTLSPILTNEPFSASSQKKQYHVAFYCWSLPDPELVELLAHQFASVHLSLDAQSLSESVRQRLGDKRQLKPFSPNQDFEARLEQVRSYPNMDAALYGILGLSGETPEDVFRSEEWIAHLLTSFGDALGQLAVTPLSIEPYSLLDRDPDKYGTVVLRKTFQDYLDFTATTFSSATKFHDQDYDPNLPHPYGVHSLHDPPDRVHNDYRRISHRIEATFSERDRQMVANCLRYFPLRLQLTLTNRNWLRHRWHLVVWAAGIALQRNIPELEVDATDCWVLLPRREVLARTGSHSFTAERLPHLEKALREGRLTIKIRGRDHQHWGALEGIGATVTTV